MNTTKLELSYAEFDMETLIESSNNISIDLRIKFVDIDNVLKVKMDISKSDNTKNVITINEELVNYIKKNVFPRYERFYSHVMMYKCYR